MKLAIVGVGLIGGSLAKDLKVRGFTNEVLGVDSNVEHGKQAIDLKIIDRICSLDQGIQEADLIVIATPVDKIRILLPQILDRIKSNTVVTDMGSTKGEICKAVDTHKNRSAFVASHPMAGTENSGPLAAISGLYDGKTAVICDASKSSPEAVAKIKKMYDTLGMRLIYMSASEHDLHTAYVSHLSHVSSFILASTVLAIEKDNKAIFDLAGGGFESTVRLAKSSPSMWTPIFKQNKKPIIEALTAYIEHLNSFKASMLDDNFESISTFMEQANEIRHVLARIGKKT